VRRPIVVTLIVLATACRTTPSPPPTTNAPDPATASAKPAETEGQAATRCGREHPDCRWPFAIQVAPICEHPCGLGQHCESNCDVTSESTAGTWECRCDLCGSNKDCPAGLFCGAGPCEMGRPVRHCLL